MCEKSENLNTIYDFQILLDHFKEEKRKISMKKW
jgi:hypothetical protein